jgi:glutamate--cysteine ligase
LREYVEWALDAPMFMFLRGGLAIQNTGQSFRSFFLHGFEGYRATMQDWQAHLNTLFPEVRLKQTIEVRGADSVPYPYLPALPAVWTGLLYDDQALDQAEALSARWTHEEMSSVRQRLAVDGLAAEFQGAPTRAVADRLLQIAADGLGRRAQLDSDGRDESKHLDALVALVARGRTPADEIVDSLRNRPLDLARIVALMRA